MIKNVLSLFDGISCGQVALNRAGIKYENYFACEIDKYAIKITQKNFPNTIQLGDVRKLSISKLPRIDLLIGGSPCQGFSFAGKQLAFHDPRSKLFFKFAAIKRKLEKANPDLLWLLENVEMKREHENIISYYMGVDPVKINSALLSAQNRVRLYWTNFKTEKGMLGDLYQNISQPKDRGILLKDIIESGVVDRDKSLCLDASYYKGTNIEHYLKKNVRQVVFTEKRSENMTIVKYLTPIEIKRGIEKSKAQVWKTGNKMGKLEFPNSIEKKAKTLTVVNTIGGRETNHIQDNFGIRRLTPIECERLQTLPDNYTQGISDSQRYKALGNGWTVDVIVYLLKQIQGD